MTLQGLIFTDTSELNHQNLQPAFLGLTPFFEPQNWTHAARSGPHCALHPGDSEPEEGLFPTGAVDTVPGVAGVHGGLHGTL